MQVRIVKKRKMDVVVENLTHEYGSIQALAQKVSLSKCSSGSHMEDLMIWKHIDKNAIMMEEIVYHSPDIFETLTPRRMELVEFLIKNEVSSIRKLSQTLHRDYKNVYDDLRALEVFGLIEFVSQGRRRVPVCDVESVETLFDN